MNWVLDSSLALAWVLPDEFSQRADKFLDQLTPDSGIWVPALWWYEVSNALLMAQKRKQIKEIDRLQAIDLLSQLPLQTDTPNTGIVRYIQELAFAHSLAAYDASYLELALRKSLGLATFDDQLKKAADKAGLHTF
jgi:predicted nucleic acid-binding protein